MTTIRKVMVLLAAASLTCCASEDGLSPVIVADLTSRIDNLDRHESEHAASIRAAISAAVVFQLEDEHRGALDAEFAAAMDTLNVISRCRGQYNVPVATSLDRALRDARTEGDRHDTRMRTAEDLATMETEEQRHAGAMSAAVAAMRAALEDVIGRSKSAENCP